MAPNPNRQRGFIPFYYQVEGMIREKIESGEWAPDELISSERELMNLFDISRATVIRALNNLVQAGLLYRKQGKGTFVSNKIEQGLTHFYSFAEDMKNLGLVPSTKVLKIESVKCSKHISEILDLGPDDDAIRLVRLRLANEDPIILETSYLPQKLFPDLKEKDHGKIPLYDILRKDYGFQLTRAREYFEATLADEQAARYLHVTIGDPLLLCERRTYNQNDMPVEVCRGLIRGDKYKYYIDLA